MEVQCLWVFFFSSSWVINNSMIPHVCALTKLDVYFGMTIYNMFSAMIQIWCAICVYLQDFVCNDQNFMGDICTFLHLQHSLCMVIKICCVFMIVAMFVVLVPFVCLCIYNDCVWHFDMYSAMCVNFICQCLVSPCACILCICNIFRV